jgi:hypothetical protein
MQFKEFGVATVVIAITSIRRAHGSKIADGRLVLRRLLKKGSGKYACSRQQASILLRQSQQRE